MYRRGDREEVTRCQQQRDQDRGIRTREVGAEHIVMRGRKMEEVQTFGEREPASGRESPGSEGVRVGEAYIR